MAEIFDHCVAYVEDLRNFFPLRPYAPASVVKGLAIKLHDQGANPVIPINYNLLRQRGPELRAQGYSLGIWSCPRRDPVGGAASTSTVYGALGLSFCVFETEWEYKSDGGGVDVKVLLDDWRLLRPKAYTAVATEGGPPTTFNHAAAIAHDCRLLPENYWKQDGQYDARRSIERAKALGWDPRRVHPTATGVEGHGMCEALLRIYRAQPIWGGKGIALWRGDMLTAEDYRLVALADDLAVN